MSRTILKQKNQWCLVQYKELSYFKNGRANMHIKTSFCIEHVSQFDNKNLEPVETGCFWIKTKKEANSIFSKLIKTHVLNGVSLKAELFSEKVGV